MPPEVRIWQGSDGSFRWAYREGELELASNDVYATERDARAAARTAYPDVVAEAVPRRSPPARAPRRARSLSFLLAVLALWRAHRQGG